MPRETGVLAVFADVSIAADAVRALRAEGIDVRAAMPAPFPQMQEALGKPVSLIGLATLTGAVAGGALGLLLAAGGSWAWPIVVGGMPIVSLPAFLVIVFEVAVLVGALTNFVGLMSVAALGRRRRGVPYDPRFTRDRIGLFVPGGKARARELLAARGAEEVRDVA
jgi:MFS family permease